LRDHSPLADLAFVFGLEVRPLLMHVERIAVGASLAADVADDRTLLVLETHVQPHIALHLELLAAVFAIVLVLGAVLAFEVFLQLSSALALETARVARVILLLDGALVLHALARAFRRVLSADVRLKRCLVRALVTAIVATVHHVRFRVLLFVHGVPMMLQHLQQREANIAVIARVHFDVLLVVLLILVRH